MAAAGLNDQITLILNGKVVLSPGEEGHGGIEEIITDIELERTILGASTVSVKTVDTEKLLAKSEIFNKPYLSTEAELDGLKFIVCTFNKRADEYEMKFEDREYAILANDKKPKSVERKRLPGNKRAHFIKKVIHEIAPHIEFICPELNVPQGIEGPKPKAEKVKVKNKKKGEVQKGFTTTDFRVEGQAPTSDQLKNVETCLLVADEKNCNFLTKVALICCGTQESTFISHPKPNTSGYWGVLQWGSCGMPGGLCATSPPTVQSGHLPGDLQWGAKAFLDGDTKGGFQAGGAIKLIKAGKTPGEACLLVQVPGGGPEQYERHRKEAEATVHAWEKTGFGKHNAGTQHVVEKTFVYSVNKEGDEEENTMQGLEKLAEDVKWRLYVSKGKVYYLQDSTLASQKPTFTLDEETEGVMAINYELDKRETKKPSEVEIECRAHLWEVEIGETVRFKDSMGKHISRDAKGKPMNWIVSTIQRKDIGDDLTIVKCTRPEASKAEKAQYEYIKKTAKKTVVGGTNNAAHDEIQNPAGVLQFNSQAWLIYKQAKWIGEQHYYYYLKGGHYGKFEATPIPGHVVPRANEGHKRGLERSESEGLDCSGAASWALHTAGAWPKNDPAQFTREQGDRMHGSGVPRGNTGPGGRNWDEPQDTLGLKHWGEKGEGTWITLWVSEHHCFLWIKVGHQERPEGGPNVEYAFEASHTNAVIPAPHGVGLRPRLAYYKNPSHEGFEARRWPGT